MRAYVYYVTHTFANCFKKLFRSWVVALIGIFILFGLIGGIVGASIGEYIDNSSVTNVEDAAPEETPEITPEDFENIVLPIIEMVGFAVPFGFVLVFFYTGDKSGAAIFNMSDVNFLFPSPNPPQSILTFKSFIQMGAVFFSSLYLGAQVPNLIFNLELTVVSAIVIILSFIVCIILGMFTSVCTYTVVASKSSRRKWVAPIAVFTVLLLAIILYAVKIFCAVGWFDALKLTFASPASRCVPIFGWMAFLVRSAVKGNYFLCLLMLVLIAAFTFGVFCLVWRIKADFYEDALGKASANFEKQQELESGRKIRKKARPEPKKNSEIGKGEGANAFFFKQMHVRRRISVLGVFSKTALTYTLIAVGISAAAKFVLKTNAFEMICFILLIMHFFRNFSNPIEEETATSLIFVAPVSKNKTVFWLLLAGLCAAAMDTVPAFLLSGIISGSNITSVFVWMLVFLTFDVYSSTSGLAASMILPSKFPPAIKAVFCIYLRMFFVIPGLILLIIGFVGGNIILFASLTATLNIIGGVCCYLLGCAFLKSE